MRSSSTQIAFHPIENENVVLQKGFIAFDIVVLVVGVLLLLLLSPPRLFTRCFQPRIQI